MNQNEATAIVAGGSAGPEEELAHCTPCLAPMNPFSRVLDQAPYMYPMSEAEARGWMLQRALGQKTFRVPPGELLDSAKEHACDDECEEHRNALQQSHTVLLQPGAVVPGVFDRYGDGVIFCPSCLKPIHPGEGPLSARGHRAELLRRLLPHGFRVTEEMFGEGREQENQATSGQ